MVMINSLLVELRKSGKNVIWIWDVVCERKREILRTIFSFEQKKRIYLINEIGYICLSDQQHVMMRLALKVFT